jgi:hypothetical protein
MPIQKGLKPPKRTYTIDSATCENDSVYIIHANNKAYTVSPHAATRMVQRFIAEAMVIETLENGTVTEQAQGSDLYEHQLYDDILEAFIVVRIVVDEETRTIVTVIDDTEED